MFHVWFPCLHIGGGIKQTSSDHCEGVLAPKQNNKKKHKRASAFWREINFSSLPARLPNHSANSILLPYCDICVFCLKYDFYMLSGGRTTTKENSMLWRTYSKPQTGMNQLWSQRCLVYWHQPYVQFTVSLTVLYTSCNIDCIASSVFVAWICCTK